MTFLYAAMSAVGGALIFFAVFFPDAVKEWGKAKVKIEELRTEQAREVTKQKQLDLELLQANRESDGRSVAIGDEKQDV